MTRILVIPSFYPQPGRPMVGTFFRDQALALQGAGQQVDVAFVEHRSLRQFRLRHISESHFQISGSSAEGLFTLRQKGWNTLLQTVPGALLWVQLTVRLVDSYVTKYGKPHILHAHNALWAGYAASLISRSIGIPYIVTEHSSVFLLGEISPSLAGYVAQAYSGSSQVVVVSRSLAQKVNTHMGSRQAVVAPNLVDTEYFTPAPVAPKPSPFRFLAVGNLVENKGFHILIRAFAEMSRENVSADELHIVGDGPLRRNLESLAQSLGVRSRVYFTGQLSREGVREQMWLSHTLVLPSFRETFGVVLIEALSVGLPVIATRSGGPEDIITKEVGLLVEPEDSSGLAEAMTALKSHPFAVDKIRGHALRRFSRLEFKRRYEEIFNAVLSHGAASSVTDNV